MSQVYQQALVSKALSTFEGIVIPIRTLSSTDINLLDQYELWLESVQDWAEVRLQGYPNLVRSTREQLATLQLSDDELAAFSAHCLTIEEQRRAIARGSNA